MRILAALTASAIALRLLLFFGRGDYVAFDEGWYLLLGRNLWSGGGYTLSGLQHVALSPLFPVVAGGLDLLMGDPVRAGRLVAGVAAGLLVVPCWFVFHNLGGRTTALVACTFVALMPSLAPFVAPYWIGWDLWVGAEPFLHLLLFTGLALFLRSWDTGDKIAAAACGVAFGLAYLARPEAIVAFGLLGLGAVAGSLAFVRARTSLGRRAIPALLCAAAFCITAAPYWSYLHDTLGRWAITGRGIQVIPSARAGGGSGEGASNTIEAMLWRDESTYVRTLYSLNSDGTALANGYWGVRPTAAPPTPSPTAVGSGPDAPRGVVAATEAPRRVGAPTDPASAETDAALTEPDAASTGAARTDAALTQTAPADATSAGAAAVDVPTPAAEPTPPARIATPPAQRTGGGIPGWLGRYVRALGIAVPWYVWLFVAAGLAAPWLARDARAAPHGPLRPDLEALVALPLVGTSLLIAFLVATDPRTQLFMAPLACFYAARGALLVARGLEAKMGAEVRPAFARGLVVGALALIMFATHARRLYLSLAVGSPHHIVAAENAAVGATLRETLPPEATVMSWHPAIALFAERDWRVLPLEPMQRIVRYARTQPSPFLVFSVYYPPELLQDEPHYLVVNVSAETPESERWRIEITEPGDVLAFGRLEAVP